MKNLSVLALVLGCGFCFGLSCARGQDVLVISPDEQFAFAESYFSRGQYYRAISEYERFLYFFPEDPRSPQTMYRIGESYLKGNQYHRGIEAFRRLIGTYADTELLSKAYFGMAECYERLGQPQKALSVLETLKERCDEQMVKDAVFYRQGWIYLEMNDWEAAQKTFDKISPQNRQKYRLKHLSEEINKRGALRTKNPALAGWLGIVPGAGHLYCGRPQDALIAFMVNGAMIWAAYEAFDNDNDVLGGVITFFELGLYSGNIYSAVNCAHKQNRKAQDGFLEYLKQHSVLKASVGRAVVLSYNLTF